MFVHMLSFVSTLCALTRCCTAWLAVWQLLLQRVACSCPLPCCLHPTAETLSACSYGLWQLCAMHIMQVSNHIAMAALVPRVYPACSMPAWSPWPKLWWLKLWCNICQPTPLSSLRAVMRSLLLNFSLAFLRQSACTSSSSADLWVLSCQVLCRASASTGTTTWPLLPGAPSGDPGSSCPASSSSWCVPCAAQDLLSLRTVRG